MAMTGPISSPPRPHRVGLASRPSPAPVESLGGGSGSGAEGGNGSNSYAVSLSQTDLTVPGPGPELGLARTYSSSLASTLGPFGYGWTDSYNMMVAPDPVCGASVMDVTAGESDFSFAEQADGSWAPLSQSPATLVQNPDSTWTFTNDDETYDFASSGQLVSESEPGGGTTTLSYSNGLLTTVTDSAGDVLTFSYRGQLVTQVADSEGQSVSYGYSYIGNLSQVTDEDGGTWSYGYDWPHNLTVLSSPNSQ